jgi:hypothetical protein
VNLIAVEVSGTLLKLGKVLAIFQTDAGSQIRMWGNPRSSLLHNEEQTWIA